MPTTPDPTAARLPYPDRFAERHLPVPPDPANEILPLLWMGGCLMGDVSGDHDRTITLTTGYPQGYHEVRVPMDDANYVPTSLFDTAMRAYDWMRDDQRVLVRCEAGLNRSGLVVGQVLKFMGWHPEVVIQHIRHCRSPYARSNRMFATHLRADSNAPEVTP